jgi:ribonuclease BN (tRNA processing enzyme)
MALELVVLGSGHYAPERGRAPRNPAGHAARCGRGVVLLDLGFGNVRRLAQAGLDPADVTDVFLTHRHPDHCGDVPALLSVLRVSGGPRGGRLRLWGPAGTRALVRRLCAAWEPWLEPKRGWALEVRELQPGGEAAGEDWVLEAAAARHTTPSLAYRLTRGGASLAYTGDSEYDPSLARFAAACDLFLVEATLAEDDVAPGHMTPRQALALAAESRCGEALLTHLSPASAEEAQRLLRKARVRASLARDLLRRRLPSS